MRTCALLSILVCLTFLPERGMSQDVAAPKSERLSLGGLVQFQWLHDFDIPDTSTVTNDGFRVRRARSKLTARMTSRVDAVFHISVRDNSPRLMDAFGRLYVGANGAVRLGQFKVPVWREEYERSAGDLLLIERSAVADFLLRNLLSGRQVGMEAAVRLGSAQILLNLGNGAGEGLSEAAGTSKNGVGVNNGKMVSGRINAAVSHRLQLGLSVAFNRLGAEGAVLSTSLLPERNHWRSVIAPDFLIQHAFAERSILDLEGGLVLAATGNGWAGMQEVGSNLHALGFDVTAAFLRKISRIDELGGLEGVQLAAGFSYLDPNTDGGTDATAFVRGGPGLLFENDARLQFNAELVLPQVEGASSEFRLRAQTTFIF